jgi:dipeptidyl aminopeptidase/acylaminoacyl peptidase
MKNFKINAAICVIINLFLLNVCIAQTNGKIVATGPVSYPAYDQVQGIDFYYTKAQYDQAIGDTAIKTEKVTYISDGLKVIAYLARPKVTTSKKLPVIVFNRGSYIRNDIAYVHAALFEKLVDSGFVVIAPALRQSEGGEGKDEMGGNDLDDIMNLAPLLNSLSYADTSNMFMYGESRGGMMTLQAVRDRFPLRAAATVGAFTDLGMFEKDNPGMESVSLQIWPDYKENQVNIFKRRSAVDWADKLNTPLLIMDGGSDPQVKPEHGMYLAEKMQALGKKYQLVILEGGNHILSGRSMDERDRQIIAWFKKYLK